VGAAWQDDGVTRTFSADERRARLARRHLLLPETRTDDVVAVADALVALHSTDPVTVYLSAAARMEHPSLEAVDDVLYERRALVRHHAMRRTLWVASPATVRLMHAAATRKIAATEQRRTAKYLADGGMTDPETWMKDSREQVLAAFREHGPMSTRQLGDLLPSLKVPIDLAAGKTYATTISAHTRIPLMLGFEGELVRTRPTGSWINSQYVWAVMDSWMEGGVGDLDEKAAAVTLADAWLRRFGPATQKDLQWWMGWTAALTKHALGGCRAEAVDLDGEPGYVAMGDTEPEEPVGSWVALLPALDPTTMGWKQRAWYLDPACADAFDSAGNAGPTIWADGRIVGVWAQTPAGDFLSHYFLDVPARTRKAVEGEVARLRDLVGETRFSVRFPSPVQKALLG
jgi:hypothetical protein